MSDHICPEDPHLALRDKMLRQGVDRQLFEMISNSEHTSIQHIFGVRTLLLVEFNVLLLGEHSHLVYTSEHDCPSLVITSYPDRGELRVAPAMPWYGSRHSPIEKAGYHRVDIIAESVAAETWGDICRYAEQIDNARLNYNFFSQNSNSVAATLLEAAGYAFRDLKGGGLNVGAHNLLHDEIEGGPQSRRLLFRGGASYYGHMKRPAAP
jgi:hypothetical protein